MAEWTTAYINDLPDSCFLYVEPGGKKDAEGKTVPRTLRHFPVKDASGKVDMPHLRNALSRIPQSNLPASVKDRCTAAAERMMRAMGGGTMKAEQLTGNKWRVLAIPFGGPFKGKDLDGEFFSPRTDIKANWFKQRPVVFQHGQDALAGDEEYGVEDDLTVAKDGWWGTLWLDRSARYWAQVDALLRAGKMYGSSGSLAHLVRKDRKTGEILVWPHVEQTLTPTPANPYARITASKALAGFDAAGIALDDQTKSILADLDALGPDLGPDLLSDGEPSGDLSGGGDDAAMRRIASARLQLRRLEARAKFI